MSRLTSAIMTGSYAAGNPERSMSDLREGGQHGWAPNLTEWISNQAYVSRPLICLMLEAPKMFSAMPDAPKWNASLKAMFELHSRSIEGLNAGLTVDTDEHAVGGAGEQQEEFTNVTRERSQPRHSLTDKYGRPIQTLLDYWIRYGMMDPDTKFALLGARGNENVKDLTADWYTATCIYIEPDPLHKTVDKAWLVTNMFPKGTGDIVGKRDLTSGQEVLNLDIEFAGIAQVGLGVNKFAQTLLDDINISNSDPFMAASFKNEISPDVAVGDARGYKGWTEEIGKNSETNLG